ncbi:MAG: SDR family oxidoreductase [Desulfobacterales bacterium]|nr:MAG: SDR family oxidoreductase [Desulfobacterales bacterium]
MKIMKLTDKHAVITGGGTGIGAAVATALAAEGARITLMGRRLEPLETTAATLAEARSVRCDVTEIDNVASAFEQARSGFGPVDILINNAGAAATAPFHKLDVQLWRRMMAVNLDGVFNCTRAVFNEMRARDWGRIVNVASTAALKGYAYVSAYCAAKHGVLGLTRALAHEAAKSGITVNAVCPGYTDTDIFQDAVKNIVKKTGRSAEEAMAELTRNSPLGRLIQPAEVADAVVWLCRPESAAITGQAVVVAGGEVM